MKPLFAAILLVVIILVAIGAMGALNIEDNNLDNIPNSTLSIESGLETFKEETCVDNFGNKTCVETTYVKCKGEKYEIPGPTGLVVYDKIYLKEEVEEKILVKERPKGEEKPSPYDRISIDDLYIAYGHIRVDVENAKWRKIYESNSMDPVIDAGSITIEIKPDKIEDIKIGDIVAYIIDDEELAYVHRVVDIGEDDGGVYFITKGDNYRENDLEKVRFSQIEGIVVGILY